MSTVEHLNVYWSNDSSGVDEGQLKTALKKKKTTNEEELLLWWREETAGDYTSAAVLNISGARKYLQSAAHSKAEVFFIAA